MRKDGRPTHGRPGDGLSPGAGDGSPGSGPTSPVAEGTPLLPTPRFVSLRDSRGRVRPVRAAEDDDFGGKFPALWEYLTCQLIGDKGRIPSTLIVSCEDGQVKLCLSDRETNQVLWKSARTVQEALESMERGLAGDEGGWRERKEYDRKSR